MVGFNRRFSKFSQQIKRAFENTKGPKSFVYTINAGQLPEGHWTTNPDVGGGRIIGEACHFIDLIRYFVGKPIIQISTNAMEIATNDCVSIQLKFADGSICSVNYFSNGPKKLQKNELKSLQMANI